ncbi:site-specific integrase [Mycolicibacterium fortuitum]|nr:site-specific integrase [Mycolicibacterium fortuitum]
MTIAAPAGAELRLVESPRDYLGLTPEQRYEIASQKFPEWLLKEPIKFPPQHDTFGWECVVEGCKCPQGWTQTHMLCQQHIKAYRKIRNDVSMDDFIRESTPVEERRTFWALVRSPNCVCGCDRESSGSHGYCSSHYGSWLHARKTRDVDESGWRNTQRALPPHKVSCVVAGCVKDADLPLKSLDVSDERRICRGHWRQWTIRCKSSSDGIPSFAAWLSEPLTIETVTSPSVNGNLRLERVPESLQREIRYAIHRHSKTSYRARWRPRGLQIVADILADSGLSTLADPAVYGLAESLGHKSTEKRYLLGLANAARSLALTEDIAKKAGWFDPVIVGSSPFGGTTLVANRRGFWNLNDVTQVWLRDLLWDYLRDESLVAEGKRLGAGSINDRIRGTALLSFILRQNRSDDGDDANHLSAADAKAVKDTWNLWYRDQIPIPTQSHNTTSKESLLTGHSRHRYMSSIRAVLLHSREKGRTPPNMDGFILSLPEYPPPKKSPRPRPLSYEDFEALVNPDNLRGLDAKDRENVGLTDIWIAQAFQGGRISETISLRLGCIGIIGNSQPYMWRDMTKVGVIDYGMPCYLPVYERLRLRQETTRRKLRDRYAERLSTLSDSERAQLEAKWDREMPLFPRNALNPDLALPLTRSAFLQHWGDWFESLGLKGITTHQTRATLATSLLNNGAPPTLVRQLLGHVSMEALAHYAQYNNTTVLHHLHQVWAAGPGMDKPGAILMRPGDLKTDDGAAAAARIDLTVLPVEHGLCRYGPVVGGATCPFGKNCTNGTRGTCEHFVLTGADLAYWERKREAAYHFAEGAPNDAARNYILGQWHPWESVLRALREALDELGLLEEAEKLDLRAPVHDYFDPVFTTGWPVDYLSGKTEQTNKLAEEER